MVGLAVLVVAAIVVLGLVILQTNNPSGTASDSPTFRPTARETPTPTLEPTPEPVLGSGKVTFGTGLDDATLEIVEPKTTFAIGEEISWRAELSEPAGATSVDLVLAKVGPGGTETVSYTVSVPVSDPAFDILANTVDLSPLLDGPGTYVMRYFRDATKLAEGQFTLK